MIEPTAARPGDVLLFHGQSWISWAIRTFDGTDVNHAALMLPDGVYAEAGGKGLQTRAMQRPGSGEYLYVHRLTGTTDLDPVVTRAKAFLAEGHAYAYQQIVLLALLSLTRRIPLPRLARRLVRTALDHATTAVLDLLPVGAAWMICSEYVYRSFTEAIPDSAKDPYTLAIADASFGGPAVDSAGEEPWLDRALAEVNTIVIRPPVAFGGGDVPADPAIRAAAMEADLAVLVAEYADALVVAGQIGDEDLPPLVDPSFGPPPDLGPEPTDEEMLASVASFGLAYAEAQQQGPPDASFSAVGAAIGTAALQGALQGIRTMAVDGNFVTPGDLLRSPSLTALGRIG